jgi:tetratricopeptide (TPR) repeat protein
MRIFVISMALVGCWIASSAAQNEQPEPEQFKKKPKEYPLTAEQKKWLKCLDMKVPLQPLEQFAEKLRTRPKDASLYRDRGLRWMLDGPKGTPATTKLQIAIKDYNASLRFNPRQPEVYILRGIANYDLAKATADAEYYRDAIDDFWCALRFDKKYACAYLYRGKSYYETESYADAIDDYLRALRQDPRLASEVSQLIDDAEFWLDVQSSDETTEFVSFFQATPEKAGPRKPVAVEKKDVAESPNKTVTIKGDLNVNVKIDSPKAEAGKGSEISPAKTDTACKDLAKKIDSVNDQLGKKIEDAIGKLELKIEVEAKKLKDDCGKKGESEFSIKSIGFGFSIGIGVAIGIGLLFAVSKAAADFVTRAPTPTPSEQKEKPRPALPQ